MSTFSRTIKRFTIASAGVGLAFGLVAGPAGADVGAPPPEPLEAKISLTNAVITGVVPDPTEGRTPGRINLNTVWDVGGQDGPAAGPMKESMETMKKAWKDAGSVQAEATAASNGVTFKVNDIKATAEQSLIVLTSRSG